MLLPASRSLRATCQLPWTDLPWTYLPWTDLPFSPGVRRASRELAPHLAAGALWIDRAISLWIQGSALHSPADIVSGGYDSYVEARADLLLVRFSGSETRVARYSATTSTERVTSTSVCSFTGTSTAPSSFSGSASCVLRRSSSTPVWA